MVRCAESSGTGIFVDMPTKAPRSGVRPGTRSTRSTAAGSNKPRGGMTRGGSSRVDSSRSDTRKSNHSHSGNSGGRGSGGRNNSVWGSTRRSGARDSAGSTSTRDSSAHGNGGRTGGANGTDNGANGGSVLSLIIMLIILGIALIQFLQVSIVFVQNRKELDAAKAQEAQLAAQKADLEDEIQRWGDKTYVEAQARSRLGFVYAGEKPVYLINTGRDSDSDASAANGSQKTGSSMPWYKELMYSLQKSDDESGGSTDATIGTVLGTQSSDASSSPSSSSSASADASASGNASPSSDASASADAAASGAGTSGASADAGSSDSNSSTTQ